MEIGNNLKILRKRLKKSQEEVAQDLKLTRSTYRVGMKMELRNPI
jgi:transcriptional regulator with XRE-family HTH domain